LAVVRPAAASFFVAGGTLGRDASSYVARRADEELLRGLERGAFCYVLTSRQMGKSSLMVRTAARLREDGWSVVVLDLTAIGQNLSAEQWYDGLLERVGSQLDLEDELEGFWERHGHLGPMRRWVCALEEVVLARVPDRVAIFVDEIDAVRSLPFSTDEFFAGIRELYNRRTEAPELERLTFCLLGVASPSDLIRDTRTTPFNIGRRIELGDFTRDQVEDLNARHGRPLSGDAEVARFYDLVGGHPYLVRRGLHFMASQEVGLDRFEAELDSNDGPLADHLQYLLLSISRDPDLREAVRAMLDGREVRSAESFYLLCGIGAVTGETPREMRPRCALYERYLRERL
jgi:hypothetical protein